MKRPITKEELPILSGELALAINIIINSFAVVLMLYSGAGISAISSVPFAFSEVLPHLSLGTWTYLFQGLLVLILMFLQKRFVPQYLFSFVVGFLFGQLVDVHELWIHILPQTMFCRILYFIISYLLLSVGIALPNRCGLPIVPTDLFPREVSQISGIHYPNNYNILSIPDAIRTQFINCVEPLDTKIMQIQQENNNLIQFRDWLLPMLMNGQATIED